MSSCTTATLIPAATLLCLLGGCDVDVSGAKQKKFAEGYVLQLGEDQGYSVIAPGAASSMPVWQVGWHQPFIIAHMEDGDWEVFDTSRHWSDTLSEDEFQADSRFRSITVIPSKVAWNRLAHYRNQW